jgi:hypothetical protein
MARKTSKAVPGNWYVCSGEGPISLADGLGTYEVSSSKNSTITVEIYDDGDPANKMNVEPGDVKKINIKSSLFLTPKPPDSGTAEGEYYVV